jgi:ABC-type polysaccharide/polyol phosphate transport system ATPase subunit
MAGRGAVVLDATGVSKKYCRSLRRNVLYGVQDIGRRLIGRRVPHDHLRPGEFWALRDVSFRLHRGECLGLIGANGAGKSTLLKLLSGIVPPDLGRITVRGRVSALIELGAGFHPALTGRENIYVNASILGLSMREIDARLDQIIEFSGLGSFLDTPIKFYSSGMYARLGFAIAAQLDPDVLLVDEVLAVGDVTFQERCMRHMDRIRASDRAVVLVTHSLYRVESLCDSAIWLERGQVRSAGPAQQVVREYLDWCDDQNQPNNVVGTEPASGSPTAEAPLEIVSVETLNAEAEPTSQFAPGSAMTFRVYYRARRPIARPLFNLRFLHNGQSLFECSMLIDGYGPERIEGSGTMDCVIPMLPLTPKLYDILLFVRSQEGIVDLAAARIAARFRVVDSGEDEICIPSVGGGKRRLVRLDGPMAINHFRQGAPFFVEHQWRASSGEVASKCAEFDDSHETVEACKT